MRNAFRNSTRTISIVLILGLSIGLALSMLLAHRAVDQKIAQVKSSIGNTITVSPAGVRGFDGGGNPLTSDQMKKVAAVSHVASVASSLSDRLSSDNTNLVSAIEAGELGRRFSQNGDSSFSANGGDTGQTPNFTVPVTLTGGTNTSKGSDGSALTLKSGAQIDGSTDGYVALVGDTLAEKNNLSVGSTFTAYGQTVTVKGIIDSTGNRFAGNALIMPLAAVQKLSGQTGQVTAATVTVDSIDNVAAATKAIQSVLGSSADVVSEESTAENAVQPLESVKTVSVYGLVAAVVAGSVIILLTMIMIVRERRREIGVYKAIGASDATVTGQFIVESLTLTVIAAVVGIAIALIAANPITSTLVSNAQNNSSSQTTVNAGPMSVGGFGSGQRVGQDRPVLRTERSERGFGRAATNIKNLTTSLDWTVVVYGLGTAILIAILGSAAASWFIAKIRPAEAIRAE